MTGSSRRSVRVQKPPELTTERDFHFHLICWDDERVEGTLDLDMEQVWIEPDQKTISISLSGAQLRQLAEWPSARARTKP
jgi:hypothetical protein